MLDLTKPLQAKNGFKATILHTYYNGVQEMMVVSLRRPVSFGKDVEIIKIYDTRWGKVDGAPAMTAPDPWDLEEVPPEDVVRFYCIPKVDAPDRHQTTHFFKNKQDLSECDWITGQIKVVIDGRTGKLKSTEIV